MKEAPVLGATLGRRLAAEGLKPGATYRWMVLDPATLQNAPLTAKVGERRVISNATGFAGKPRAAYSRAAADERSSHWASSIATRSGAAVC